MDSSADNPQMHRSISMPIKPRYLEPRKIQRSKEKEDIYVEDYYPESPVFERSKKLQSSLDDNDGNAFGLSDSDAIVDIRRRSRSANNFPYTKSWVGSTIEINTDLQSNEIDPLCSRKRLYRVIEKNGRENVIFRRIPEKSWRYIRDFVTTLVRPLLRFIPRKCITQNASSASVIPTTPPTPPTTPTSSANFNLTEESFLNSSDLDEYKESRPERVTFTLYS